MREAETETHKRIRLKENINDKGKEMDITEVTISNKRFKSYKHNRE